MINFRYHVVSLTAVFLALAIGLVVGTAALNGTVADELRDKVSALSKQNQQYRSTAQLLEDDAKNQEQFANEAAPYMLYNRLTGRRVLLVSMQATSGYVKDVLQDLNLAGAKVTGQVEIEDRFTDPANNEKLLDLANSPSFVGLGNPPLNSDGVETSSYLIGSVLVDRSPAVTPEVRRTLLKAYADDQFIVADTEPTGPAEAVVFLAAQPYTDNEGTAKNTNLLTIADQLDKLGALVVTANGAAGSGNVIAALRGDPTLSKTISTVDNVATPSGRIAVALAVAEQVTENKAGQYGRASGATSLLPGSQ